MGAVLRGCYRWNLFTSCCHPGMSILARALVISQHILDIARPCVYQVWGQFVSAFALVDSRVHKACRRLV
eukprot:10288751-Lingulodinium_polyedra.AAC.1